jgi:hypothetical protein
MASEFGHVGPSGQPMGISFFNLSANACRFVDATEPQYQAPKPIVRFSIFNDRSSFALGKWSCLDIPLSDNRKAVDNVNIREMFQFRAI